ncbi:MAG: hypothetical protein HY672_01455 [Chloroflexi bacterium]|nr:hypothetical protein [Chloroflexota bacterium]
MQERQLTAEEIQQIVQVCRIVDPGFTEDTFAKMMSAAEHLDEAGFVEAAWAVAKLRAKYGDRIDHVPERLEQLLRQAQVQETRVRELQAAQAQGKEEMEEQQRLVRRAQERRRRAETEAAAARQEAERAKATAEQARADANETVARAHEETRISLEEIAQAATLKRTVEEQGLTLGFVLDLCREIPDDENARQHLAEAIQEHSSLRAGNEHLREAQQALERECQKTLQRKDDLEAGRDAAKEELADLEARCRRETPIHDFFDRWYGLKGWLGYLATWNLILFRICRHCGCRFLYEERDQQPLVRGPRDACPRCGLTGWVTLDHEAHIVLSLAPDPGVGVRFSPEVAR